jgi:hypothetical protein
MTRKSRGGAEAYISTPHKPTPQIDAVMAEKNRFQSKR